MHDIHAEQLSPVPLRQGIVLIDDELVHKALNPMAFHHGEKAEGIGIGQLPVLVKPLPVKASLHIMKAACIPAIVSRIQSPEGIECHAKGVSSTLRKNFIHLPLRVITPDILPE